MNSNDCGRLVEDLLERMRAGFEVHPDEDGCRIVAPLFRRDGDPFELTVHPSSRGFVISDEGATLDFLQLSGINIKRNQTLETLLEEVRLAHQVGIERGELAAVITDPEALGSNILRVLAAMNDVSQFELARRERPPRTFDELVEGELLGLNLNYEKAVTKQGFTRERHFTFGIDSGRNTVIEPLSAQSSTRAVASASVLIVSVLDVRRRGDPVGVVAVLDDRRAVWEDRAVPDLLSNGVAVVHWTRRHSEMPMAIESPPRQASTIT